MWPFFPIKIRFSQLTYRENPKNGSQISLQINLNEEKTPKIEGIEKNRKFKQKYIKI